MKNRNEITKNNNDQNGGINMKEKITNLGKTTQGSITVETWHGGRQGDLNSGTWHGGIQRTDRLNL